MWVNFLWRAALSPGRRAHSALAQLRCVLDRELEGIRGAGTWKSERVITSRQGPCIRVEGISGGILNFCANNYLGLSSHPEVIQAGLQALEEFGAGLSSTRFICGTQSIHKNLEAKFRSKMEAAGFTISGADHPICPVMLGDARLSSQMAEDMLKKGIFVIGFSYPVVPKGKARIRVQISAVHSEEDIDRCVEAFVEVGKLHGALP
ncbi:glycine C-acetyltransferase (2-amino-3-ketobutyrate-coenzyme A ligase), isoform CRA_c [Rattus norvegicus]|uniref:Glycine C-acetyltransferase (2-amino-3-ketobutyrate-coenzyme A ligase), isoform CRA_c n=1 Tax=Rattus norvegicus TaxID=10116 RepID=A6HSP0_RAT|nr:glycine C-acetyltransferase (2-amino-3-ketobutyrate-coenzyme A ligase), isoform CRA_c [Rattus norvegicus]